MQDTKYYKTDTNFTKNFRLNEANSSCDCNFMTKPSKRSINLKNEINNYVTKINNIKNLKKKKIMPEYNKEMVKNGKINIHLETIYINDLNNCDNVFKKVLDKNKVIKLKNSTSTIIRSTISLKNKESESHKIKIVSPQHVSSIKFPLTKKLSTIKLPIKATALYKILKKSQRELLSFNLFLVFPL